MSQQMPDEKVEIANHSSIAPIVIVGALLLIAVCLIFVPWLSSSKDTLSNEGEPSLVSAIEESPTSAATQIKDNANSLPNNDTPPPSQGTSTISEQPWAEKQRSQAREYAQDVLGELIDLQKQLTNLQINEWAPGDEATILALAEKGDEQYALRKFEQAQHSYEAARDHAKATLERTETVANICIADGSIALDNNDIPLATQQFKLAVLLNPDSEQAKAQLARANVREQLFDLETLTERQLLAGELDNARETLKQAMSLDEQYAGIAEKMDELDERILDRNYRSSMSQGYAAMRNDNLHSAESAFKKAEALRPNSDAPKEAMIQVEAARTNTLTQTNIDHATRLEASEQWSAAFKLYSKLHTEDPSLTSARLGKLRTEVRARLNTNIEQALNKPTEAQY